MSDAEHGDGAGDGAGGEDAVAAAWPWWWVSEGGRIWAARSDVGHAPRRVGRAAVVLRLSDGSEISLDARAADVTAARAAATATALARTRATLRLAEAQAAAGAAARFGRPPSEGDGYAAELRARAAAYAAELATAGEGVAS